LRVIVAAALGRSSSSSSSTPRLPIPPFVADDLRACSVPPTSASTHFLVRVPDGSSLLAQAWEASDDVAAANQDDLNGGNDGDPSQQTSAAAAGNNSSSRSRSGPVALESGESANFSRGSTRCLLWTGVEAMVRSGDLQVVAE
jgi:hypothetical protein